MFSFFDHAGKARRKVQYREKEKGFEEEV